MDQGALVRKKRYSLMIATQDSMRRKANKKLETVRSLKERRKRQPHRHLKEDLSRGSLRTFREGWQFPVGLNIMTGR